MYNDFYEYLCTVMLCKHALCIICVWWENHFENFQNGNNQHVEVAEAFNAYIKLDFFSCWHSFTNFFYGTMVLGPEIISAAIWKWFCPSDSSD